MTMPAFLERFLELPCLVLVLQLINLKMKEILNVFSLRLVNAVLHCLQNFLGLIFLKSWKLFRIIRAGMDFYFMRNS